MHITPDSSSRLHLDIAGHVVGAGEPAFLIAEIGVNHDGRRDTAMRLVEAAWEGGADAVKLQVFSAGKLVHPRARLAAYQVATGAASPNELLKRLELDDETLGDVVGAIRQAGMIPIATPFSPDDVDRVADLQLPAVKLASPDIINGLLINAVSELKLPMLLSTGASTQAEIDQTVFKLTEQDAAFALLHCVSSYPTADGDAGLARITDLAARYACVVGYSDHTENLSAGALAVAAGAKIVEKHLTHNRSARGPDHAASADPRQFIEYAHRLREAESLLGASSARTPLEAELDVRSQSRQSLVAKTTLPAGSIVTRESLTCQRPGTGVSVAKLEDIVGMIVTRKVPAGAMLDWADVNVAGSATQLAA